MQNPSNNSLSLKDSYTVYINGDIITYSRIELYPYYALDILLSQKASLQNLQKAHGLLYAELGGLI